MPPTHQAAAPDRVTWGVDDRRGVLRVRNSGGNVFVESRLPSGPCSPHLALAATLAAGLDGLDRRLDLPGAGEAVGQLPGTLATALDALEGDQVFDRPTVPIDFQGFLVGFFFFFYTS